MARGVRDDDPPDVTVSGVTVKRTSDKAILIVTKDGDEIWLPKSQLRGTSADGVKSGPDIVDVTMSAWIAGEKGLASSTDE